MKLEGDIQTTLAKSMLHVRIELARRVLAQIGYGEIQILGRRLSSQKSKLGGCELLCQAFIGRSPVRILIKLINDDVRTRMLDELVGAVNRTRSSSGILISTYKMGPRVALVPPKYHNTRIEVIDGPAFASLLQKLKVGVLDDGRPNVLYLNKLERDLILINELLSRGSLPR